MHENRKRSADRDEIGEFDWDGFDDPAAGTETVPERGLVGWWLRNREGLIVFWIIVVILVLVLYPMVIHFIYPGHAAVKWERFTGGTQTREVYLEGMQVTFPWDQMTIYDVRLQEVKNNFSVITSNGLTIDVDVSIRFRPQLETLPILHKTIGTNYVEKIIVPEVQSLIRTLFGQYSPEEIYTSKNNLLQNSVEKAVGEFAERYIVLDDLMIKAIHLPPDLKAAIERKNTEEQRYLEMEYRVKREEEEANRKKIEAGGVHMFQEIIAQSLTPEVLKYKSIEAALALALSPNRGFVVFGGGGNGMPIILDGGFMSDTNAGSGGGGIGMGSDRLNSVLSSDIVSQMKGRTGVASASTEGLSVTNQPAGASAGTAP